jgi:multidrug efflux system membrane fusion protein
MKKTFLIIAFLAVFITGCTSHKHSGIERPAVAGVGVNEASIFPAEEFYEIPATVKTVDASSVSSMLTGRVTSLKVKEGDTVFKGQLLLTIDSRDTAQKAIGAEAGMNEALKAAEAADQNRILVNKTYERYKNLYDEKVMTKQEFDTILTKKNVADIEYERAMHGVKRAKAGLGEVNVYRSYSQLVAPISGVVVQKNIDEGSTALAGQPLLVIENQSGLEIEANINESLKNKVKTGQKVILEADDKTVESTIFKIVPKIDPTTRTFKAKIALKGLTSGQYVKVKIPVGEKNAILIPKASVVEKGQLSGVYAVDNNNVISYRLIKAGKIYGDKFEVLSGLTSGEKIITSGMDKAVDGGVVK